MTEHVLPTRGLKTAERFALLPADVASHTTTAANTATVNRGSGTETSTFSYTLQGWLSSATSTSWLENLYYASPAHGATSAAPGKAGLVTEWKQQQLNGSGATTAETFAYTYDLAGRLKNSVRYLGTATSSYSRLTEGDIGYDLNGNLTGLTRYNESGTAIQTLSYSYNGPKRSNTGWTYDNHGNLTADPQGSMSIAWNVLDMPRTLTSGSASTQRAYLADGTLAQIYDGSTTRLYVGDMVFTRTGTSGTPVLESAAWEGGRLLNGSGTDKVLYYVTDHLGSVRTIKDGAGTVRQRFDYYPYGSVSRVYTNSSTTDNSVKRYRFGGKEIAGAALTDLAGTGAAPGAPYLDFGARLYSPRTATWLSVDPMAEKYYGISPLTYCAGNPVNLVDPTGRDWYFFDKEGHYNPAAKVQMDGEHLIAIPFDMEINGEMHEFYSFFHFADPINDPIAIDSGDIDRIQFVSNDDIFSMIKQSGGFDVSQMNFAWNSRGGKQFDYSSQGLLWKYNGSLYIKEFKNGTRTSNALFLPEGEHVAHNYMNFGNFLWAANGSILGLDLSLLRTGAHINSLVFPLKNGYPPQFDSKDDQRSIVEGFFYAIKHNLSNYRTRK